MSIKAIYCTSPSCSQAFLRKSNDGLWRVSAKTLVFDEDGNCKYGVCRTCGTEVNLPLSIKKQETQKSLTEQSNPILVPFGSAAKQTK